MSWMLSVLLTPVWDMYSHRLSQGLLQASYRPPQSLNPEPPNPEASHASLAGKDAEVLGIYQFHVKRYLDFFR